MRGDAAALKAANDQLTRFLGELYGAFDVLEAKFKDLKKSQTTGEMEKAYMLRLFRQQLLRVKLEIPYLKEIKLRRKLEVISEAKWSILEESTLIPQLHRSPVFETSMEFKDFEARYYAELEGRLKLCLLCFSIFPQGATVKKRLMLQWWLVEGFASSEQDAQRCFEMLIEKGFIEAVNDNGSLSRIHPFHRSALVALAERAKLFNFGSKGDPTQSFSGTLQACLMGAGIISYDDFRTKIEQVEGRNPMEVLKELIQELEKLHLVMNVDEHILEFKEEWFAKMKNLNFLHLGSWKEEATHHIEVRDPKFLEALGKMKFLKYLSLQGVSNIPSSLPQSILQLTNLEVLDLRACDDLESIPERIDHLRKLTHLDMSECSWLDHMPKGLSRLTNLKVLKGFFIPKGNTKSCTLRDLWRLKHLEKLCIRIDEKDVLDLEGLMALTKLSITWTWRVNKKAMEDAEAARVKHGKLPLKLEKLDLRNYPMEDTPDWLKLENMEGIELKKLYIRGGKICDLGQYQGIDKPAGGEKKWRVEVLRLKYLGEIEMEWRQLRGLFPELKYLEKVSCPKLTLFPCDAKGVWININPK